MEHSATYWVFAEIKKIYLKHYLNITLQFAFLTSELSFKLLKWVISLKNIVKRKRINPHEQKIIYIYFTALQSP